MTKFYWTTRDLVDLAQEYEMIRTPNQFYTSSQKIQAAILKQIKKIADQLEAPEQIQERDMWAGVGMN